MSQGFPIKSYLDRDQRIIIGINDSKGTILVKNTFSSTDTLKIYHKFLDSILLEHPMVWDIEGKYLYQVSSMRSNTGFALFKLNRFIIDSIQNYSFGIFHTFSPPSGTILDKGTQPINLYNTKVTLGIEDVGGPFFYDIIVSKDSLIQLVYNESKREIEFWNFEHFRLFNDYELKTEDRQRIAHSKRWGLINTIPAPENFVAPFNIYNQDGRYLILSGENKLYSVVNNELRLMDQFKYNQMDDLLLLIDKKTDTIYVGNVNALTADSEKSSPATIVKLLTRIHIE
ncbi:MAG: hypothetical protein R2792_06650 [Saprospiraceae bacterium]